MLVTRELRSKVRLRSNTSNASTVTIDPAEGGQGERRTRGKGLVLLHNIRKYFSAKI